MLGGAFHAPPNGELLRQAQLAVMFEKLEGIN